MPANNAKCKECKEDLEEKPKKKRICNWCKGKEHSKSVKKTKTSMSHSQSNKEIAINEDQQIENVEKKNCKSGRKKRKNVSIQKY